MPHWGFVGHNYRIATRLRLERCDFRDGKTEPTFLIAKEEFAGDTYLLFGTRTITAVHYDADVDWWFVTEYLF